MKIKVLILAATHLVPNPFDPQTSGPPLPVPMDKWSPWTNGPQPIWSPWTNGPPKFGTPGQMVPNKFGPHISKSSQLVPLDKQNILGTICPGGPNWMGTICLGVPNFGGPFAHGDEIGWGPFVQRCSEPILDALDCVAHYQARTLHSTHSVMIIS